MTFGITRVHGTAVVPSQRPSTVSHFTITFPADIKSTATTTSDIGVVDGALDRIFKTAVGTIATTAMIGTVAANGLTLRFAIEDTGADATSPSYLGTGPTDASPATTAAALQAAIQALGTVNGIALGSATVAAFVY